ncbi:MAG: glycosyltransferase [Anaerolineae bacterium]|nr:glycosyltransferase [Anaerolineae bacterium]
MRILFLSQVLPYPLDAGPKMRSYYVLRHLVQDHEVTLVTFVRDSDRPEYVSHLAEFCHAIYTVPMQRSKVRDAKFLLQSVVNRKPFLITRDYVPAMIETLQQLTQTQTFDIIHADQLWMAQYALKAKVMQPTAKLIIDKHNAVHHIPQRLANEEKNVLKRLFLAREAQLMTQFEPETCQKFDFSVWVTEVDRLAVLPHTAEINGRSPSKVIPICANPAQVIPVDRKSNGRRITFLGGLHWPPNAQGVLWFAEHVFPKIQAHVPDAVLTAIGKNPPTSLTGQGIEKTGYVVDPLPYLAETAVFIVPLHAGGGMRVKILDAWSWGLPIVSTTIGAEGIEVKSGSDILIADTADEFANAVISVLNDPSLAQQLSQNGRQTVLKKYNWQTVYAAWNSVYQEVMALQQTKIH